MRNLFVSSIFLTTFAVSLVCSADQTQDKVSPQRVAELLEKLGSTKFAEREQAMKELDSLGVAALPMLRPALKSPDAEVRRRVEMLVRKFEDMELTTKLLTAKMVRLKLKDATLAEAAAELAKQSYPIEIPGDQKTNTEIKITLDTGETTFWQALHQIGLKTGITDKPAAKIEEASKLDEATEIRKRLQELSDGFRSQKPFPASATIPLGKAATNPVCFAGSVRITLVKTAILLADGIHLVFEVSGEPHLLDLMSAATPTLDNAIDEQNQKLTAALLTVPIAPVKAAAAANLVIARAAMPSPMASQPRSGFQSFQVTLRLGHPAKQSQTLTEICGKIPVQTTLEGEPTFIVDNILKAAGQTIKGKEGKAIQVLEVSQLPKGEIMIKVAMESVNVQNPAVGGIVRIQQVQQIQQIQNGKIVQGNNVVVGWGANGQSGVASALRLLDTAGKAFTQNAVPASSMTFDGAKIIQTETIVFTPQEGQGAAVKLVLPGYRQFSFEVPFSFKDVELDRSGERWE